MAEKKAYSHAAGTGKYDKSSGLSGKYDNVRRFWEEQVTDVFLRPALNELVERKRQHLERIRILDIGCGSGDGYDLLMDVTTKDPGLYEYITAVITPDILKEYVGLDINEDLLKQAREHYANTPKMRFIREDISNGLPASVTEEEPFDVYFTSYGTLSHFNEHQSVKLLADICRHAPKNSLFVGDWLGRYSYEWQDLWHHPADQEFFMDYRISYIYPEDEREQIEIPHFPLRLMNRDEALRIINQAAKAAGVEITPLVFFDRSISIGRHMETGDYNKHPLNLRESVNSLFEGYMRTRLKSLLVDYVPRAGYDHLNNFFEMFFMSWNTLVKYTISLLSEYDSEEERLRKIPDILPFYPDPLKEAMHAMRRVIEGVGWVKWGDARANVIEPHLGYSLRQLEMELQAGNGIGHGLVGIFEIKKQAL